jgi:hypothetical protein
MKFIKQSSDLCIQNYDSLCGQEPHRKRHGGMLPDTVRAIFVGSSGSGKTNAVFNLLFSKHGLRFKNVYVFCKSLQQKKYRLLENVMKGLPGIGYFTCTDNNAVMHPNDALPHSVMVFDDVSLEKQDNVKKYFCFGRHNTVDCIYIGQSYASIGKHMVRDNANVIVLFKQDDLNLKHIYADHVSGDLSFETFKELCYHVWDSDKHAFVMIDKENPLNKGRYRKNFDTFIDVYK